MIDLTIKQYIKKNEPKEYDFLRFMNANNSFSGRTLNIKELTYEEVKAVVRTLGSLNTWEDVSNVFETSFKVTPKEFEQANITEFFSAKNFIIETFKKIVDNENKLLSSISADSVKWQSAGGDRLNKFGDVLGLNQLAKIYSVYPFDLGQKKYYEILMLLTIEKEQREIETIYNKMK